MKAAVETLLADLKARGVYLEAAGDKLRVNAPKGFLTPQVRAVLLARKAELLARLGGAVIRPAGGSETLAARVRGQQDTAQVAAAKAEICWHCRGQKDCRCALCGRHDRQRRWVAGHCWACLGTGYLAWPATVQ